MVVNFLICVLVGGAIYLVAYPDTQIGATTSVIRQIWSGSCRLGCRNSEFSGFSGLSGLVPDHAQDSKDFCMERSSHAGPSSSCICESCPCAVIENVLRTCRPATTMYKQVVELTGAFMYTILETLSIIYQYFERILACRTTCQRQPQLTEDTNSDKIYFGSKKFSANVNKSGIFLKRADPGARSSKSIIFRDAADIAKGKRESSKNIPHKIVSTIEASDTTLTPTVEQTVSPEQSSSCPKCIEKGKVCMRSCPTASKKKLIKD